MVVTISTPFHPETPEELAARIRGLEPLIQTLADASGVLGAHAAQQLRAEHAYIAHRVQQGTPNARQTRDERTPIEHETDDDQQRNVP